MAPKPIAPVLVAPDTWLVTELVPAMPGAFVPIRSAVIAGAEPVIVDAGTSLNRHAWTEAVWSIVDPQDVRWVFVSHDDHDHVGNLPEVLAACPQATLVANWFIGERLAGDLPLPLHRMRWVNDGERFDVGDRELHALRPPIFDAPSTRGLLDPSTGFYWAADGFASMVTEDASDADDLDEDLWEGSFRDMNRQLSPWHELVDQAKYERLLRRFAELPATTVVGAHGAVLRRGHLARAYQVLAELPGLPGPAFPAQADLDALLATRRATPVAAA